MHFIHLKTVFWYNTTYDACCGVEHQQLSALDNGYSPWSVRWISGKRGWSMEKVFCMKSVITITGRWNENFDSRTAALPSWINVKVQIIYLYCQSVSNSFIVFGVQILPLYSAWKSRGKQNCKPYDWDKENGTTCLTLNKLWSSSSASIHVMLWGKWNMFVLPSSFESVERCCKRSQV